MNVIIQSPTKSDYQALEQIHKQAVGEFENSTQEANFHSYIRLNSNFIRIALKASKIVGYILGYHVTPRKMRIY
jgi:predicted N-acetyltransferase YhbS